MNGYAFIVGLIILRLLIWSTIIWLFCDRRWEHPLRLLGYAMAGTAFSFLLDAAGIALAFVAARKNSLLLIAPGVVPAGLDSFCILSRHFRAGLSHSVPSALR